MKMLNHSPAIMVVIHTYIGKPVHRMCSILTPQIQDVHIQYLLCLKESSV